MKELIIRMSYIDDLIMEHPDKDPSDAIKDGSWLEVEYDGVKYSGLKNVLVSASRPLRDEKGLDDRNWKCQITFEKDVRV